MFSRPGGQYHARRNRIMLNQIWETITREAREAIAQEPFLEGFLTMTIIKHASLCDAVSHYLSERLENDFLSRNELQTIFLEATERSPVIRQAITDDLQAIRERDPASRGYLSPFLHYKGYHALESYRVAHWLWEENRPHMALLLQSLISRKYAVDIHPGARIGKRIFIDHATGIVIGETAVVGDDVSMLHEVTLGGTGKATGDRHPKIGNGVLIGAGAKILGNISVGEGAKIGAGSVVLSDIPPHTTVVGIPARVVGTPRDSLPSLEMDQTLEGEGFPAQ